MRDWMELADEPDVSDVAIEKADAKRRHEMVERIEDELLSESREIVSGTMAFAELDESRETCPDEWVARYGREAAERRFRLARFGLMSAKEAPVGIMVAKDMVRSVLTSKARRDAPADATLNLQVITMRLEPRSYEVIDVTEASRDDRNR